MSICQNGVPPMQLSLGNITVATDQSAITRGIGVSMGTPPQIVSLRPSFSDNALYVVNKANCAPGYNSTCIGEFGGVFDYSSSKTFLQVAEGQWNGSNAANPTQLSFVTFNDVLTFGNATIYGYPAIYDQPGYGGQGVVPLGWDSDLLKISVENGDVPSTVFGVWTGSRSVNNPVDGSLVIGGYDSSRIIGEPTTFASEENCETCVTITELSWDSDSGSTSLFANSTEVLNVSLQPSENYINLPQPIFEIFQNTTAGVYVDPQLRYSAMPTGNLSVTLKGGYKTTIPAEELFMLPRHYDDTGKYTFANDSYLITTVLNQTVEGYYPNWGIPYLTMNYVIGDYKRAQFKMAPANRTDFSQQGIAPVIKASCDPMTSSTATPTSSAAGSNSTSSATSAPSSHHKSSNTGAIAGGVVGGVVGLALIVGAFALFFQRRRRRNAAAAAATNGPQGTPGMTPMMSEAPPYHQGGHDPARYSQWTALSPTEVAASELDDSQKQSNIHVNQWLSSHGSDTQTVTSATSPPTNLESLDRPHEMPAQPWDTR